MTCSRVHHLSDSEAEEWLNQLMIDTGERERLREKLKDRLTHTDWRESVKLEAKDIIEKKGPEITMEDLVQEMAPKAASLVPEDIRRELTKDVHKVIEKHAK